jgi:CubicO group peptidase (beta-lactamase class C family)
MLTLADNSVVFNPIVMKQFLLLVLCSLLCTVARAQATPYAAAIDSARTLVRAVLDQTDVPGAAVTVMVGDRIVWSEGFGYADLELGTPVRAGLTKFRVGSVSKPLTAAALGVLHDQGRIDLDAPIQTYVPGFPEKRGTVTLRLLAGHLAGIRHYRGDEFLSSQHYPTVAEGLDIFAADTLLFAPGTRYSYSSYGWNLISAAIESAADTNFLDYVQYAVFSPLGMTQTAADYTANIIPHRTRFYSRTPAGEIINAPYVDNSYKWAGGGFIATSDDLARFARAHLAPGYLSAATLNTWLTPQQTRAGESTGYGIGWRQQDDDHGHTWIGHSGGSVGGITQMIAYPEQEVIVVLLTNSDEVRYENAHHRIAHLFFSGSPED